MTPVAYSLVLVCAGIVICASVSAVPFWRAVTAETEPDFFSSYSATEICSFWSTSVVTLLSLETCASVSTANSEPVVSALNL